MLKPAYIFICLGVTFIECVFLYRYICWLNMETFHARNKLKKKEKPLQNLTELSAHAKLARCQFVCVFICVSRGGAINVWWVAMYAMCMCGVYNFCAMCNID